MREQSQADGHYDVELRVGEEKVSARKNGCDGYNPSANPAGEACGFCAKWPTHPKRRQGASGFVIVLPFNEGQELYDIARFDTEPGIWPAVAAWTDWLDAGRTKLVSEIRPPVYVCPSDKSEPRVKDQATYAMPGGASPTVGSYAMCMGDYGPPLTSNETSQRIKCDNTGMFLYAISRTLRQVTDGTSNTFEVGEVIEADGNDNPNVWSTGGRVADSMRTTRYPLNTPHSLGFASTAYPGSKFTGGFGSNHAGGGNFLYVDGHVSFVSDNVADVAYNAAATISGAEAVEAIQ